jgi:predicted CoA-binding protein
MITDRELAEILKSARNIAVVGISSNPARASHGVSGWLKRQGFHIIPVNPAETEVHGEKAYASLADITEPIDIVDIFRRSDQVLPIVQEAIAKHPRLIFMQEGVVNEQAASLAEANGIPVVMDRCILKELARLAPLDARSGLR